MFGALKIRDYRFLWGSNLCTSFAMQMQMVARGWLIYSMTSSTMALTWVMLAFMLPSFIFSPVGGVIADRYNKKNIMIVAGLLNTIATLSLAYIIYSGQVDFWHFIFFGIFNGIVLSINMPARSAAVPEVVGQDRLVNAMALQSATFNLARVLGPALAGLMIALFADDGQDSTHGVGLVFFTIGGLYCLAMLANILLKYQGKSLQQKKKSVANDAKAGFRYIFQQKLILGLLCMGFLPATFGFSASFLLPAFNQDVVLGGAESLGYLMTALGSGALCGSLLLARMGDIGDKGRVLFICAFFWAAALCGLALCSNLMLALLLLGLSGMFSAIFSALNMSLVQLLIKPEFRGRVMSLLMMSHGLMPIGVIPISLLAEYFGVDIALLFAALMLIVSVVFLGALFPDLRRINKGHQPAQSPV